MDNSEQATMKKTIAPPKKDAESMTSSDTESDAEECEVKQIFQPAEGSAGGKVALDHSTCPTKTDNVATAPSPSKKTSDTSDLEEASEDEMRLGAAFTRTLPGQKKKIRYVIADGDEDTVLTLEEAYDRDPWEWVMFCMQPRP